MCRLQNTVLLVRSAVITSRPHWSGITHTMSQHECSEKTTASRRRSNKCDTPAVHLLSLSASVHAYCVSVCLHETDHGALITHAVWGQTNLKSLSRYVFVSVRQKQTCSHLPLSHQEVMNQQSAQSCTCKICAKLNLCWLLFSLCDDRYVYDLELRSREYGKYFLF